MKLTNVIKEKALIHAKQEAPRESVGLVHIVKGRERYFPCRNLADEPNLHFCLDPNDYLKCEKQGQIVAVIHSHPTTNPQPSEPDKVACERNKLPWFIVNPNTEKWGYYEPSGFKLPYVGRQWAHGIIDCYTLWKDWYKGELNIEMSEYNRQDYWWNKGENLYIDNFKNEGMREVRIEDIQYGDIILMNIESPVPNHAAIYLGENLILHHVHNRLSSRDVYKWGGYYHKMTAKVLRHESR
tara:strand:+ start:1609 stop:2328 length:720 start_codon:yes stop_codon:yes gene_type:complete